MEDQNICFVIQRDAIPSRTCGAKRDDDCCAFLQSSHQLSFIVCKVGGLSQVSDSFIHHLLSVDCVLLVVVF